MARSATVLIRVVQIVRVICSDVDAAVEEVEKKTGDYPDANEAHHEIIDPAEDLVRREDSTVEEEHRELDHTERGDFNALKGKSDL